MKTETVSRPIGVFDSGMGGISVLADLVEWMPNERFIYFGDTANAPYGVKSKKEVGDLAMEACAYLADRGVKAIVVACNTATSAAIGDLRKAFALPVVGMEPALKVAVDSRPEGRILVMATPMTLKERKFKTLMERFSEQCRIETLPAPELVDLVESGVCQGEAAETAIRACLEKADPETVSTLVLGCTHFVFLEEALGRLFPWMRIVHGNKGTARHLMNLLTGRGLLNPQSLDEVSVDLCSSSEDPRVIERFKALLSGRVERLMNEKAVRETEKELRDRILKEIHEALDGQGILSETEKRVVAHRYGIRREKIADTARLARELKLPKAKVEDIIDRAERKLFNLIKNRV